MRLTSFIIQFIVFIVPLFSQYTPLDKVDSLLEESYNKFVELQIIESLKLSEKAMLLSEKKEYEKGLMYSYLSIARALQEVGLRKESLEYIEKVENRGYFKKDPFLQADTYWLRGRIASSQHLYSLEKEYHLRQLDVSQRIADFEKRELSIVTAYYYLQNLYVKQNNPDSAIVYQEQLERRFSNNDSIGVFYKISLYADKASIYKNLKKFDAAAKELEKSLKVAESSNSPFLFYPLQVYGDLELKRGDTVKAISYYKEALNNSVELNIDHQTMLLHQKVSNLLMHDELTIEEAKNHLREYDIISDSLERHNKMVSDLILSGIVKQKDEVFSSRIKIFIYIVVGLISLTILLGIFLIIRNRIQTRRLMEKNQQLESKTEKIGLLEEEIESSIFQDIIELAKSNSPEFLPLFGEGYPEFVEAMKELDPNIRSTELYFCALAYLNFSTKDIAKFTFVTTRAVQVRRNRMRKKYDIPSEVDFNEWFRSLPTRCVVNESYLIE